MVELNDKISELASEKQASIDALEFGKAGEVHKQILSLQAEFDQLRSLEQDREDVEEYVFTRSLMIAENLLTLFSLSYLLFLLLAPSLFIPFLERELILLYLTVERPRSSITQKSPPFSILFYFLRFLTFQTTKFMPYLFDASERIVFLTSFFFYFFSANLHGH